MNKKWVYKNPDAAKVRDLSAALGISKPLAALLLNRNISTAKEAELFLNPDLSKLHNPFLLPDMEKSVIRIREAIDRKEKILVFGDRDVDGVTSITVLVRTLKGLGADVAWTVPGEEGYGLHNAILQKFKDQGCSLVITVDCGTSAVDEIAFANSIGMEVIVTDHHLPPETLPNAFAIVNPNLLHSQYPMKELAGCLTAFKLAYALMFTFNRTFNQEFIVLDLETTGLNPGTDEIVEIGALLIRNFLPIAFYHTLIRPSKPISPDATRVHGITDEMVKDSPSIKDVLPQLMKFIGDRTIVAHNAKFDLSFLHWAQKQHFGRDFSNASIDTLTLSRECFSFRSYALTALVKELRLDQGQAHRSMDDCRATAELFKRIEEIRDPRLQFFLEDQLDVVTLGTIADIVPLLGENRVVVKHGLPRLLQTRKVGLKKLMQESGIPDKVAAGKDGVPTAKDIAWSVTPLINAAGRFSRADLAVRLLLTNSEDEAVDILREIVTLNQNRKNLQKANVEKFLKLAQEQCDVKNDKLIFVVAEGMEHGVTGIAASQLVREFQRPVLLLIKGEKDAMGSSRSLPSFNIVEALKKCEDLLIKYGGHPAAAGMSVEHGKIELLRERLKRIAQDEIDPDALRPQIDIDLELELPEISLGLIEEISRLEPFGEGNPPPVFAVKGAECAEHSLVGAQKNHLRLRLACNGKSVGAIGWKMSPLSDQVKRGEKLDLCFQLEVNTWENRDTPQLVLSDLLKSELTLGLDLSALDFGKKPAPLAATPDNSLPF